MKFSSPHLSISDAPFCIGAQPKWHNPCGLPDTYPLELVFDADVGRLCLSGSSKLDRLMSKAYALGVEMGTPSDDSDLGKPYVDDFLDYIALYAPKMGRLLEIGAGVGYLSRRLIDLGWDVTSVEPGKGYEVHWLRHGVDVINDFYPCPQATGPYDAIVLYTVLEHIEDTAAFLRTVKDALAPGGKVFLSVPDCTLEIEAGDPSMLVHQHYQYFTQPVMVRTLAQAGLEGDVRSAGFGRSIYACAQSTSAGRYKIDLDCPDIATLKTYPTKVSALQIYAAKRLEELAMQGSLGVYCPARGLYLVPQALPVRFFDDATYLAGRYYPPFRSAIETRADFLANPPDALVILSRTFGDKLKYTLQDACTAAGLAPRILSMNDLLLPEILK